MSGNEDAPSKLGAGSMPAPAERAAADPPRSKGYFWLLPLVLFIAFLTAWGILFRIAAEHRPKEVPRASATPATSP